ncbi:MAG: hypothetical protein WKG06_09090 [Segetibacter sp.]
MKAAILNSFGRPLTIERVESPLLGTGEVIVKVIAVPVPHYAKEVFNAERNYMLKLPLTLVGRWCWKDTCSWTGFYQT